MALINLDGRYPQPGQIMRRPEQEWVWAVCTRPVWIFGRLVHAHDSDGRLACSPHTRLGIGRQPSEADPICTDCLAATGLEDQLREALK